MPNIRGPELLVLVLIIVVLFGAKRLPDAARGIGRSLRIFKAETKGLVDSDDPDAAEQPAEAARPAPQALPESAADSSPTAQGSPGSAHAGPQHTAPEEPGAAQPSSPPAPPVPPTRA